MVPRRYAAARTDTVQRSSQACRQSDRISTLWGPRRVAAKSPSLIRLSKKCCEHLARSAASFLVRNS